MPKTGAKSLLTKITGSPQARFAALFIAAGLILAFVGGRQMLGPTPQEGTAIQIAKDGEKKMAE